MSEEKRESMLLKVETRGIPFVCYDTGTKKFSAWADVTINGEEKTIYLRED
jgi:hypothetical protein